MRAYMRVRMPEFSANIAFSCPNLIWEAVMADRNAFEAAGTLIAQSIHQYRTYYLAAGALFILGGALAILFPFFSTLAVTIFVGWVLILSGGIEIAHALVVRGAPAIVLNLLAGLLSLGVGFLILSHPLPGAVSLTLLLAGFLAADGVIRILSATQVRYFPGRDWIVVNGISSLVLAAALLWLQPEASLYALGILLGMDMLMAGVTFLMLAGTARKLAGAAGNKQER